MPQTVGYGKQSKLCVMGINRQNYLHSKSFSASGRLAKMKR